ncbi:MAG TPA: pullulanase-associated domain-containing protein [Ideonella sp.]|nr:pullulanase-associated domain-containing protein [Ideonella sp.]
MTNRPRSLLRAATFAALCAMAAGPSFAAPPEGMVTINYNRCDARYNWGLHIFQRGPGGPAVPGVSWANPMDPTGSNDFGAYWNVKLADFPEGKVNYIIHRGDNKDQGGKDMQFDGNAVKEIWVNSGDPAIYTSMDEAKKAREAQPCK